MLPDAQRVVGVGVVVVGVVVDVGGFDLDFDLGGLGFAAGFDGFDGFSDFFDSLTFFGFLAGDGFVVVFPVDWNGNGKGMG